MPSHLYSTLYTCTYKYLSFVLLCQYSVWILFSCYVIVVCHPCHTLHYITTLSRLSLLYITHHSACFTCYMYVHIHHANVCSVLHMLIFCLDHATHASSLHTYTVLVYHTYMYTHSIHCLSVVYHVPLFVRCYKTLPWCKRFACAQCSVAMHDERFNSYHRGSASRSEVEAGSEVSGTKLPSCVTVKTYKASHLCCTRMTCNTHTLAQLMRPGIGRDASCAVGD